MYKHFKENMVKNSIFFILFAIVISDIVYRSVSGLQISVERNKRYLSFPDGLGNKIQVICGFGIPVDLSRSSLTYGYILKTNYILPENATRFTQPETIEPMRSQHSRFSLYQSVIAAFERFSLGGKDCLLRSICEAAFAPLDHDGLIGEIVHVLLTPSTSWTTYPEKTTEYHEAEDTGRRLKDHSHCSHLYPHCSTSFLDLISTLKISLLPL